MNGKHLSGRNMAQGIDALGARLATIPGAPQTRLELRIRWLLAIVVLVANGAGAAIVLVFTQLVIPSPDGMPHYAETVNLISFLAYPVVAGPAALLWGLRVFAPVRRLVRDGGIPDREQRHAVLLGPARLTVIQGTLWLLGAVGWTILNAFYSPLMALKMGMTCLLGAITTLAIVYLLAERLLRPAAALVLAVKAPREHKLSRVTSRSMIAWALGTAVPLLGIVVVAIVAYTDPNFDAIEASRTILVLGCTALLVSFQVTFVAARAVGDPIQAVREGMAQVERGDLETEIEVYDASELGQLQAGFNTMVTGLRAHERLQDLFSRHVGSDVAELALRQDVSLGGEIKEVAVLFVDLAGSTKMASERPPDEVVTLLNLFFGVVVDCVNRNGGWINKFEGDAALAIFGAPVPLEEACGRALIAAREMAVQLQAEVPQLLAGIGVSAGPVVAGYIGAEQRFEYTVIGDPVNEAARLSDLAKGTPGRALANAGLLEDCDPLETSRWVPGQTVTLRGRNAPTVTAAPRREALPIMPLPELLDRARSRLPRPARKRRSLITMLAHLTEPRDPDL
ncbi:MAG: adenylate/guanylate cyclase domain-containing protein [Streptosporangiaceae bacterium]